MNKASRQHRVPNANSPQLLTRLLETVARGIRSSRGIQESLGVDVRTVQYYSQAADWLGLMESSPTYQLTPIGLEYVYAGRNRAIVYARAVWSTPFVTDLMRGKEGSPSAEDIAALILSTDSEISASTARRRASSVRSLIGPALEHARAVSELSGQLSLPLPEPISTVEQDLNLMDKNEYNPDVYRLVWGTLLDCGELSLHQLRAVLDKKGADDLPIGGAIELAVERGDAIRRGEQLIATPASLGRRELLDTTTSIMLSDLGYRAYLHDAVEALEDRPAAVRRDQTGARYRYWDRRLFGRPLRPEQLNQDLESVLLERPLSTFPIAEPEDWTPEVVESAFLDSWDHEGIAICLPGFLRQLHGGVVRVNQMLRTVRLAGGQAQVPSLASRTTIYHGGILHPGEPLPRSVPDARSLRLRAVMHSPFISMLTALLLLHRYRPEVIGLGRVRGVWEVSYGGETVGELLDVLEAFCVDVGMVVCRSRTAGIRAGDLIDVVASLGLGVCIGELVILSETFFAQLREDAEEIEIHMLLQPLMEALDEWLASVEPPLSSEGV